MRRSLLVLALLACLAVSATVAADSWMQPRGDAAATGFQPEEGPEWPDVALRVQLNGSMKAEAAAPPLILEEQVLFLAREAGDDRDGTYQVYSLRLDDGRLTTVAQDLDIAARLSMATDGETLFVSDQGSVHAVPVGPGGSEWTWPGTAPSSDSTSQGVEMESCWRMSLEGGHLTVLCLARDEADTLTQSATQGGYLYPHIMIAQLDAETGEPAWVWDPGTVPPAQQPEYKDTGFFPVGLAVSQTRVVVQALETSFARLNTPDVGMGQARYWVWALEKSPPSSTGSVDWRWASPPRNMTQPTPPGPASSGLSQSPAAGGNPAVTEDSVYVKASNLYRLNLGPGDERWKKEIGEADFAQDEGLFATGVALDDDSVYGTSAQTVYRVSQATPEDGWSTNLDFSEGQRFQLDPVVTPGAIYVSTSNTEGVEELYAFDTADGKELWTHKVENRVNAFSVVEGLIAYADVESLDDGNMNTTFVVLGQTEASPSPRIDLSTTYPEPGEPVQVNLSSSEAGLQGPVTRFKAIWGDGNETDWQEEPGLNHTYADAGDQTARFIVANDANQTASTTQTFHVGQNEPTEPTWLAERFEKDNQDMTFGVLGILVAVSGGAIGVARRKRKQANLQEELETLEAGFEDTRDNPGECEAFLETRKARARSLMLDGDLTEEQFGVIESRIEELGRELRSSLLDERFQFLPYGMVQSLKKMLADGKISGWEREAFETLLEDDEALSEAQKEKVRHQLDRWFAEDARGGAA